MQNAFLQLVSTDAPGTILGVVIADGKFACKIRFGRGTDMAVALKWVKDKFCRWAKCGEEQIEWGESLFDFTVEMKVKG